MAWIAELQKLIHLKARYIFGAWAFGALLIFLPPAIIQQMHVEIPEVVKPWLGFGTLAAFVLWLVQVFLLGWELFGSWRMTKKAKARALRQFDSLSQGERDIFLICLSNNQRTLNRAITDSEMQSLITKGLMARASGVGNMMSWSFTIPQHIWEYVKENEEKLFPEIFDENAMVQLQKRLSHGWMS